MIAVWQDYCKPHGKLYNRVRGVCVCVRVSVRVTPGDRILCVDAVSKEAAPAPYVPYVYGCVSVRACVRILRCCCSSRSR